jgi:hypothetical protein
MEELGVQKSSTSKPTGGTAANVPANRSGLIEWTERRGIGRLERGLDLTVLSHGPLEPSRRSASAPEQFPRTLEDALDGLRSDIDYPTCGGGFPSVLIEGWLTLKVDESRRLELQPHSAAFRLHADI